MCVLKQTGPVVEGERHGRTLGFPTANIESKGLELRGTYVGCVTFDGFSHPAAIYADADREILEAHLLNFSEDIYGKEVHMELKEKIADAVVIEDEDELSEYVKQVVLSVSSYFSK